MNDQAMPASMRDLASIFFKWKWSVLFILIVGLTSTVVWLWVVRDDLYETKAKVLVKIGYEQAPPTTVLNDRPMNFVGYRAQQDVNSEADILQNDELLGQVVDELGLDRPPAPPPYPDTWFPRLRWRAKDIARRVKEWTNEVLITAGLRPRLTRREMVLATLKDGLVVASQKDSNIVVARLLVERREGSSVILNTLLDRYMTFRLKVWKNEGQVDFFDGQVAQTSRELAAAENELRRFEATWDINVLDKEQDALLVAIAEAQALATTAETAMKEASAKVERLDRASADREKEFASLGGFPERSFPESLMQELSALQREREKLRMTEFDDSVRIRNVQSQIDLTVDHLAANVRSVVADRKAVLEARTSALAALKAKLVALHSKQSQWTDLKRQVKVFEEENMMYRQKLGEATGLAALERDRIGNVAIVERATDPLKPSGIRKLTLLGIALTVVVFAALAWVSVAEFLDHGIYTADALQARAEVPVLAVIPGGRATELRRVAGRRTPAVDQNRW
jgi:uncharacterized protein involved in exopolysaccharide biosynthesis